MRQMLPVYRPTIPPGLWGEAEAEWPWGRGLAESVIYKHAWWCWLTCACTRPPEANRMRGPQPHLPVALLPG